MRIPKTQKYNTSSIKGKHIFNYKSLYLEPLEHISDHLSLATATTFRRIIEQKFDNKVLKHHCIPGKSKKWNFFQLEVSVRFFLKIDFSHESNT